jgi:hypothetical protein
MDSITRAAVVLATLVGLACGDATAQKPSNFLISGTVLALDGAPIRKARITAESDRPCSESGGEATEADANGRFELRLPCAGVWRLSGEATGFPKQRYEQHDGFSTGIVLNAAHPAHEVVFRMAPSSSILGTVLDEAGEPVRDAKVFLLMAEPAGEEPFRTVDQTITDDRGLYEFSGLSPAGYFVAVQAQPWYAVAAGSTRGIGNLQVNAGSNAAMDPSLDVTYPITYFPAATDAASASTVEVAAGATQQADPPFACAFGSRGPSGWRTREPGIRGRKADGPRRSDAADRGVHRVWGIAVRADLGSSACGWFG